MTDSATAAALQQTSRIRLHNLAMRPDGDEWIVGRFENRLFVALPRAGAVAIDLLRAGQSIEQTTARLIDEQGCEFDVLSFVAGLMEFGFVAEVDGRPVPAEVPAPASFPRVHPKHVRWALSPILPVLFGCLMLAGVLGSALHPYLLPSFHDLLWSQQGSAVLALAAGAGWSMIFIHELAHFVVARAAGVHARIQLGTRLQFLIAETDISGIELAPRRHRLTAYLAGIATNLSIAAVAVLLLIMTDQATTTHRILAALLVIALLPLPFQFMIFMRTDVYFVLQDITGCRNLFGDGTAYARYTAKRLRRAVSGRHFPLTDPSLDLPEHERRAVRIYSVVLVIGTALCLATMALFTIPTDLTLIARALHKLGYGQSAVANLDSVAILLILGGANALWAITWWRRRRILWASASGS